MNQTEFNEMWVKIAKENPEFVSEINQNPVKESCIVTISTKEGYDLACVNFHYVLITIEKPVENLSMLVANFEYEYTNYDVKITTEQTEKINKIRNTIKGDN